MHSPWLPCRRLSLPHWLGLAFPAPPCTCPGPEQPWPVSLGDGFTVTVWLVAGTWTSSSEVRGPASGTLGSPGRSGAFRARVPSVVPFTVIVTMTQEVDNKVGKPRPREKRDRPVNDRAGVESGRLQRPLFSATVLTPGLSRLRAGLRMFTGGREEEKNELVQTDNVLSPLPFRPLPKALSARAHLGR